MMLKLILFAILLGCSNSQKDFFQVDDEMDFDLDEPIANDLYAKFFHNLDLKSDRTKVNDLSEEPTTNKDKDRPKRGLFSWGTRRRRRRRNLFQTISSLGKCFGSQQSRRRSWFKFGSRRRSPNQLHSLYSYNLGAQVACTQKLPNWKSWQTVVNKVAPKYLTYGCYCGKGGGGRPLDDIDRCCETHDADLKILEKSFPSMKGMCIYFKKYTVQCIDGHTRCDKGSAVERALCKCDQKFAKCIRKVDPDFSIWNPRHNCVRGWNGKNYSKCGPNFVKTSKNNQCPLPFGLTFSKMQQWKWDQGH